MPKINIQTHVVRRVNGKSDNWGSLRLITLHRNALNEIGETGQHNGKRTTIEEYFEKEITDSPKKAYKIQLISRNPEDNSDELFIIEVTV